jgi:hypothetical protein
MATINKRRESPLAEIKLEAKTAADAHENFMGGTSFDVTDPILRLRCMAASSFFGEPQYYRPDVTGGEEKKAGRRRLAVLDTLFSRRGGLGKHERNNLQRSLGIELNDAIPASVAMGLTSAKMMENTIDEALTHNAIAALDLAVSLRREDNIRVTPQVIVVRAANLKALKGSGLIRRYARAVMQRPDEPATQLAYQRAAYGDAPIPNGLKRAWRDFLAEATEYGLAKYRLEGRSVKTVDVVNLAHPASAAVNKLVTGELKLGSEGLETWESKRSAGESWEAAIPVMGHMALLRNIRNFEEGGVSPALWTDRFIGTAATGKQLPFRYFSAYREVEKVTKNGRVLDAIEEAMEKSLSNLPSLPGRSLVLTDNSGSATGTMTSSMGSVAMSTIGNLMGILTARISAGGGDLGVFGDRLKMVPIRQKASVLEQLKQADHLGKEVGASTEHGIWLAFDQITREKEAYDNIFVYSDMQAGHGGLYGDSKGYKDFVWSGRNIDVAKLARRYRNQVNSKVNIFLVQIAGYDDTIIPEYYDRTFIIGG